MTPPSDRAGHQPEPPAPLPVPQPSDEAGVPAARNTDRRGEAATGTETGAERTREKDAPQDGPEEPDSRADERDGISHLSWEQDDRPPGGGRDDTAAPEAASPREGTGPRDSGAAADREEAEEARPVSALEFDEDDRDPKAPATDTPDQNEDAPPPDTPEADADGGDLSTPVVPAQAALAADSTTPAFVTPDATTQVTADLNAAVAGELQPTEAPSSAGAEHTTATTTVQAERERPDTTDHHLPPLPPGSQSGLETPSQEGGAEPEEHREHVDEDRTEDSDEQDAAVPDDEPDRLAVATHRDIDLEKLGMPVVWRTDNLPLHRSDNRDPAIVFDSGFEPRDPARVDLAEYVEESEHSAHVSTSYREDIGGEFGGKFTYQIDAPGGIDVNASMGDHPLSYEEEVAFPGGVRTEFIVGARPYDYATDELGDFIPNPNYRSEAERAT